ncbi:MAG: MBL fold metallo-hydrolase [Clostridia bacterium]|nr:MBL fold metallo-hydrolase [Clostridia bacterium]
MKVTWLGGAGLLFEGENARILVNCVEEGAADVLLFTSARYLCPERVAAVLKKNPDAVVLASRSAYAALSDLADDYNITPLSPHSVFSEKGITFYAVRSECADEKASGFILDDGKKTYYVSGDTLYNYEVLDDVLELVEDGVDYAFLPINGRGGSMNAKDAADFAYELGAENAVPLYYGARPGNPDEFDFEEGKIVLLPNTPAEL